MLFLAMTAGELERCEKRPSHPAFLSCQFSVRHPGLSNIPKNLPRESMIILTDQTPISGHDPNIICRQLGILAEQFSPIGILLDFQRPGAEDVVRAVCNLPCPVGVSEQYASCSSGPVFLSPAPLCRPLHRITAPWNGRELWLDTPVCNQVVTVTTQGAELSELLPYSPLENPLFHKRLGINYQSREEHAKIIFTLSRSPHTLSQWTKSGEQYGITHYFCLFQEYSEKSS